MTKGQTFAADDLAFRFRSGRLCLDLLATVADREGAAFDRWRVPADLGRWGVEAGLLARPPRVSAAQLGEARLLREAVHRLLLAALAGAAPEAGDLATLNGWTRRPALAPQLEGFGRPCGWAAARPVAGLLALAAGDAVALLSEGPLERV
ncbi:MAG: ABATE domain-containing protein, partial [Tistlia sp.]